MWPSAKLKFVARFGYGDALPTDEAQEGPFRVFGSNGPYASFSRANTGAPAIVVGRKGSYGKVNWTPEPCYASDTTFFVDESTSQNHLRWIFWLLQTLRLDEGTDEAAVPGLNRESAYSRDVLVPPVRQQRAIADYLDRETARLDALVAAKERVLGLLAEKRRALITRAVTRGLNDRIAPVMRLKFLLDCIDTGFTPQSHNVAAQQAQCGVLKSGCVNGGIFNPAENKLLADEVEPPPELEVRQADVLMSRASGSTELIGSVALVREQPVAKLYLSDKTFRLRVNIAKCEPEFLVFAMGSAFLRNQIEQCIRGAEGLANNIAQSDIREFLIPVPPPAEQRAIVAYIATETAKLNELRAATERTIALLKERRAALISAAVTGRMQGLS